jgi:hypothetical protein
VLAVNILSFSCAQEASGRNSRMAMSFMFILLHKVQLLGYVSYPVYIIDTIFLMKDHFRREIATVILFCRLGEGFPDIIFKTLYKIFVGPSGFK